MSRPTPPGSRARGPQRIIARPPDIGRPERGLVSAAGGVRAAARSGFTLIEMVGVLAVIMVLAALVFSATVRQLDEIEGRKEDATLARLSAALERSIQRNRSIPGPTNWIHTIAADLGAENGFVSHNPRQNARVLWIDPRLNVGGNGLGLPYSQTMAGSLVTNTSGVVIPPQNPRLLLLSSLGPAFPSEVVNGGSAATNFDAGWNLPHDTLPAGGPWAAWGGLGRDLRVQRVNLSPLFVRVMLNNHASPGPGRYTIDWQNTNTVPNGAAGVNAYFIKGTTLGLLNHTGVLEAQQIVTRNCSYVYNLGVWRGTIFNPPPITPPVMEYMAELFYRSPQNPNAGGPPDTPGTILDAMEAYMAAYNTWAALGTWPKGANPDFQALNAAQVAMSQAALNLMNNPPDGGCE